jgi:uncharacterized protein YjiS (DUF1127 family)
MRIKSTFFLGSQILSMFDDSLDNTVSRNVAGTILVNGGAVPSSYELRRQAQRDRNLVMNALLRSATRHFVKWLTGLARGGVKLARELADEQQRRREIRALLRFDDRALADMGLGRSEIESEPREPSFPAATALSSAHLRAKTRGLSAPYPPFCFHG